MGTHPVTLHTSDGLRLVGDVARPDGAPAAGAVVCHPHPQMGGDRTSPVVVAAVAALQRAGVVALRFDFRGVNGSEGAFDRGIGERLDVVAALDELEREDGLPGLPLWLVGYSFGSLVALGVDDPRAAGWVAIAPPLALDTGERPAAADPRPVHVVAGGRDQWASPEAVAPVLDGWTNASLAVIPAADHFFAGHLPEVGELVAAAVAG